MAAFSWNTVKETTLEPAVLDPAVFEESTVIEPAVTELAIVEPPVIEPKVAEPAVVISKNDTVTVNVALGSAAYYALEEVKMQMKTKVTVLLGVVHK